jgi:hypothetical protein
MLLVISAIKLVAEIALMTLLGRGVLALLAGQARASNPVYRLLAAMTRPFDTAARRIAPRVVIDRHLPWLTGLLLALVWLLATLAKISVCLHIGLQACR